MDLQQSIRGDDLSGDFNLQEVNLPLLSTVPSYLFANFSDLKTIKLDTASILHRVQSCPECPEITSYTEVI